MDGFQVKGWWMKVEGAGVYLPRAGSGGRAIWRTLVGLVYPRGCLACGRSLPADFAGDLCRRCAARIEYIGEDRCPKCGHPLGPHVGESREACPSCRPGLYFEKAVGLWRYEGAGRDLIHRWKYDGVLAAQGLLVRRLVDLLAGEAFTPRLQIVVPVPMHWVRRLTRRFNQAELLARGVARGLSLQFGAHVLSRTRNTPSQTRLSRLERLQNVRGAFWTKKPQLVKGKVVLLVDDVVTTCATAAECARTLRMAGAKAVYVAALAR